jgi:hypothetical protein
MGSALQAGKVMFENRSDTIEVYLPIKNYSSPENLSVEFYYAFQQDVNSESSHIRMRYDPKNGLWTAEIPKKYDSSVIGYWINITDYGADNLSSMYADYGPAKYSYTTPLDFQYTPCLIGAVIVFAAFEVFMHYGKIREKYPREPEESDDEMSEKNEEDTS